MESIAIVGIGCRFPGGADGPQLFWDMLIRGVDATIDIPDDRWSKRNFYSKDKSVPGKTYQPHGGFLQKIDHFDAEFFGISPREASYLDPQQRILLEVSWEAMEDAGIIPENLKGKNVGVYIGAFTTDFKIIQFQPENVEHLDSHSATGMMMTMLSNRISYIYDFRGPSMTIDTACSSSLVSVHLACDALKNGECSVAIAGGVNIITTPQYTISESKGGFLSPDGKSKSFDSSANGYARGEGAGVVVLKTLSQALADGDYIYGVIKATAVNQDGHTNGITVPNGEAQEQLLKEVYRKAGISPGEVCYVEAHGTGTPVGDPIEANAIANVLKIGRREKEKCIIGSVKTNIGHLESAAGIAGLIKACLVLKNKTIPPHLHLNNPNPKIPFDNLCIRVATEPEPLIPCGDKALIGVNAFGFGGTNAHILLEEAPVINKKDVSTTVSNEKYKPEVITISAHSEDALNDTVVSIKEFISSNAENMDIALEDIVYTLAQRRSKYEYRLSFPVRSKLDSVEYLDAFINKQKAVGMSYGKVSSKKDRNIVFVYSGMGPIWWAMGRQLYAKEPVFRKMVERCDELIREFTGWSVTEELLADEGNSRLDQPMYGQPANFVVQVALTELWRCIGIIPSAVVGHSVGEVAAAYVSGRLNLREACKVSVERSRIQQNAVGLGTMLAVGLSETEAEELIEQFAGSVSIAAINSHKSITLSGDQKALEKINNKLEEKRVFSRFLKVNVAYHSSQMDPYEKDLIEALEELKPKESVIPIYSTVTGKKSEGIEYGAEYWWKNVRQTVRFEHALNNIINDGYDLYIEVGPHPVLKNSIVECMAKVGTEGDVFPSLMRGEDEQKVIYGTLGNLYVIGYEFENKDILQSNGKLTHLPLYSWQRKKYWHESEESIEKRTGKGNHQLLGRRIKSPKPTWENYIDFEAYPYLRDHNIEKTTIFPGAGYIETAFAFIKEHFAEERCVVEEVRFDKALFLKEDKQPIVQFAFEPQSRRFQIYSRYPGDEKNWTINSSGKISKMIGQKVIQKLDLDDILLKCNDERNKEQCYELFSGMGFDYGHYFKGVEKIYRGEGIVLSRIKVLCNEFLDNKIYSLHPTILDACFQGMIAALTTYEDCLDKLFLPVGIDSISLFEKPEKSMWCYSEISEKESNCVKGDIFLYNDDGNIVAQITGFKVKEAGDSSTDDVSKQDNCLFNISWVPYDNQQGKESIVDPNKLDTRIEFNKQGLWIIFEDDGTTGELLADELERRGQKCIKVKPGENYCVSETNNCVYVNPQEEIDYNTLFTDVVKKWNIPLHGIFHLWNLNATSDSEMSAIDIQEFQKLGCISVLNLAKALEKNQLYTRMWICTRGVHSIIGHIKENVFIQAPVWGIGKVIGYQELPRIFGGLIDLDPINLEKDIFNILEQVQREDTEDQVAYRNGCKYVPRLVKANTAVSYLPSEFKTNKSYIITGAFGALGMLVGKWMAKHGARRLILVGRTEFPQRNEWVKVDKNTQVGSRISFIRELEAMGVSVHLACIDVTNGKQLNEYITQYNKEGWPSIAGIVHTAGIVRDELISEMSIDVFNEVLKPKVQGTWNLHKTFESEQIDFFVLFSSVSSILNVSMGQANYASANMFIDVLSSYRRAQGLPAISINWGPWSDVGMASKGNLIEFYKKRGIGAISPSLGIHIMERVMNYNGSQIIALPVEWTLVCSSFQTKHVPAMIAYLGNLENESEGEKDNSKSNEEQDFLQNLLECNQNERKNILKQQLVLLIGKIFRIESTKMDTSKSLSVFGMDSIIATEIRSKIEMTYNVPVSIVELMQGINIDQLTEKLIVRIDEANVSGGSNKEYAKYPQTVHDFQNAYAPFQMTDVQMAYLTGRDQSYMLGGIGTHIYMEIRTILDVIRLNKAVNIIIERHPMLRTVFLENGKQKILDSIPKYKIHCDDISHLDEAKQKEEILKIRERLSHQVFSPFKWPLFGIYALKLSETENYLFIDFDMLIVDGTSWQMIGHEMFEAYNDVNVEVHATDFTFRDYMLAYTELKKTKNYEVDRQYWLGKLKGFPKAPQIPLQKEPKNVSKTRFKRLCKVFGKEEWIKIKEIAKKNSVSTSALLCTVYAMSLAHWSNQYELAVNVTVFNRYPFNKDIEKIVGDFTSIVVLGLKLDQNAVFWDNVRNVQGVLMEALDHRLYDGIEFIRELSKVNAEHNNLTTPIVFTSMLTNDGYGLEGWQKFGKIEMALSQTPQVYLDNQLVEVDGELYVNWDYVEELFCEQDILRMFDQYTGLISQLAAAEGIDLIKPIEKDIGLINKYNDTDCNIVKGTLHGLFNAQVLRTPKGVALIYGEHSITYEELDEKSTCVALLLKEKGIGRNDNVAVIAQRCIETIAIILGILKAGAAYVPLDPKYPEDRKAYIIENSKARLLLTPELFSSKELQSFKGKKLELCENTEDTAYIIYTSGSTGRPKGVVITHGAVTNTIIDINRKFDVNKNDRIIGLSSMCFDLSVYDIFGALSTGAALVIIPTLADINNIVDTIKKERITLWNSVPSIMDMTIGNIEACIEESNYDGGIEYEAFDSLRTIMLSGDWIPLGLFDRIKRVFPDAGVISLGGATEASIWSIYYPIDKVLGTWKSIPYGMPLANQKFYVLNDAMVLCPVNVQGELYIGGVGLAVGYMNDDKKTRNAFVMHPELGRLYKTGDYGILRNEGYIEFLGRKDSQVKIRGHRIELGEIENCIIKIGKIKNAVVVDRIDSKGDKYLCAYIVSDEELDDTGIMKNLGQQLPEYMIPKYYMRIDIIPLSSNGKVNRKLLPEPNLNTNTEKEYMVPRNDIEQRLQDICKKILQVDDISINEDLNYFGWNSVSMISFSASVHSVLGVKIPFGIMLAQPTIESFAKFISSRGFQKESLVTLLNERYEKSIFAFPGAIPCGIVYKELATKLNNYSIYGFEIIDDDSIIDLYCDEITRIQKNGPYLLLGYSGGGNIAFEVAKELSKRGCEVPKIILIDSYYELEKHIANMDLDLRNRLKSDILGVGKNQFNYEGENNGNVISEVEKSIDKYLTVIERRCSSTGMLNSNIHYICSEGDSDYKQSLRDEIYKWSNLTSAKFDIYNGFGIHDEMLASQYVEKNANVLKVIIGNG